MSKNQAEVSVGQRIRWFCDDVKLFVIAASQYPLSVTTFGTARIDPVLVLTLREHKTVVGLFTEK